VDGKSKARSYSQDDAKQGDSDMAGVCPSQPTLTKAEREAIKQAADDYGDNDMDAGCHHIAATLRGLLERTK
jgi:hypothetical protein